MTSGPFFCSTATLRCVPLWAASACEVRRPFTRAKCIAVTAAWLVPVRHAAGRIAIANPTQARLPDGQARVPVLLGGRNAKRKELDSRDAFLEN